ncbi:MAG: glycosyltransferase family 1 protein [Acidobacteriota bacterium]
MKMKIGIDVRVLQSESGSRGIGVYTRNLILSLLQIDRENEYIFFAFSQIGFKDLPDEMRRRAVLLKRPAKNIIFWDQLLWYPALKKWEIDLFHTPFYAAPVLVPSGVAVVQTVHDLIPVIFKRSTSRKNRLVFRTNFSLLRFVDRIIAVSSNTKADIIRILGIPGEKIEVIHNGVDHLPVGEQHRAAGQMEVSMTGVPFPAGRPDVAKPYLLYVGGLNPLKNVPVLLQAFDKISRKYANLGLVIVGADSDRLDSIVNRDFQKLIRSGRIVLKGYLENDDLVAHYRNAELFIFPSLYEGFGIPPLEAMRCGLPVIASSRASIPEILGDAAAYVNPEKPDELVAKIETLLQDEGLRIGMREAGLKRAAQFSWREAAQKTLALYRMIHEKKA